ncbi:thioredoxin [candidate division KSB1 bacterium]|nr:thioredoxin [candidate division KSB1 bacterium]
MIDEHAFFKLLNENPLFLGYFTSPECAVCKSLLPKLEAALEPLDQVSFHILNCQDEKWLCGQHLVFSVPTLLIFYHGREVKRFSRFISVADVPDFVDKML